MVSFCVDRNRLNSGVWLEAEDLSGQMSKMSKLPSSFQEWRDPIEKTINKKLQTNFDKREANQIIKYIFRTGGKQCRPLLADYTQESIGGERRCESYDVAG